MRRIPRPAPATVIAMIALIVAIGGTAYATGEGKPILGGARNPGSDKSASLKKETQIIATTSTYGTRQSNKSSSGGGAIYGCRSAVGGTAAGNEPCIRANNLSSGLRVRVRDDRDLRRPDHRQGREQRPVHDDGDGRRDRPQRRPRRQPQTPTRSSRTRAPASCR